MGDCPVVETAQGNVKGYVLPKANEPSAKPVYAFTKIPFAKPPVGDLRFEPPQKAEMWSGILDGTQSSPNPCQKPYNFDTIQSPLVNVKVSNEDHDLMSEDCLYLNVYTPNVRKTANLPDKYQFFSVAIGDDFLPEHPETYLKKGEFSSVPYIIGCNSTEGYGVNATKFPTFDEGMDKITAMQLVQVILSLDYLPEKTAKAAKLVEEEFSKYFLDDDKYKWSKVLGSVVADTWFVIPSIQQAVVHADNGNETYMYKMTYKMRCSYDPEYRTCLKKRANFCEADHADDIIFTFGMPFAEGKFNPPVKFTPEEKEMCREWLNYIGNFARTGNPNDGKKMAFQWPRYDCRSRRHLVFKNPFDVDTNFLEETRQKFWLETIKKL